MYNCFILVVILMYSANLTLAQENINAAGGDSKSQSGSVSYSVGQNFYSSISGNGVEINEGIQQPYEVYNVISIDEVSYTELIDVYPNPTQGKLTIELQELDLRMIDCQVYDLKGNLVQNIKINSLKTDIFLDEVTSGTYLVYVKQVGKTIQTFKIIKN